MTTRMMMTVTAVYTGLTLFLATLGLSRVNAEVHRTRECLIGKTRCWRNNLNCSHNGNIIVKMARLKVANLEQLQTNGSASCDKSCSSRPRDEVEFGDINTYTLIRSCNLQKTCDHWQVTPSVDSTVLLSSVTYWCSGEDMCAFSISKKEDFTLQFKPSERQPTKPYGCHCSISTDSNITILTKDVRMKSETGPKSCSTAVLAINDVTFSCDSSTIDTIYWKDGVTLTGSGEHQIQLGPLGMDRDPESVFLQVDGSKNTNVSCHILPIPAGDTLGVDWMVVCLTASGILVVAVLVGLIVYWSCTKRRTAQTKEQDGQNGHILDKIPSSMSVVVDDGETCTLPPDTNRNTRRHNLKAAKSSDEYDRVYFTNTPGPSITGNVYSHVVVRKGHDLNESHDSLNSMNSINDDDLYDHVGRSTHSNSRCREHNDTYSRLEK